MVAGVGVGKRVKVLATKVKSKGWCKGKWPGTWKTEWFTGEIVLKAARKWRVRWDDRTLPEIELSARSMQWADKSTSLIMQENDANTSNVTKNSLSGYHRPNSQMYLIAKVFERNPNKEMTGQYVNTWYSLLHMRTQYLSKHPNVPNPTVKDLLENVDDVKAPGDVQRQLRTFYEKHQQHGIKQRKIKRSPIYKYDPTIMHGNMKYPPRCFSIKIKEALKSKTHNKCEICGDMGEVADHWRPWSKNKDNPNITTEGNAVWLCEKCNLIKKDHPSIRLVERKRCTYSKWTEINNRITKNGFPANDEETRIVNEIRSKLKGTK
jgi:hypothetical protein